MKLTKKEIKEWLLSNCVNEAGDLDLSKLDFSDFNGNVITKSMVVKKNLYQDFQEVGGDLYQDVQIVNGDLFQSHQAVKGDLYQSSLIVKRN